ncbi:MAG: hypothetical protein ACQETH_16025 [Candidatus Rifleibacteriota bacterium]
MFTQPTKADWKKFMNILPELRERYLKNRNKEISNLFLNVNQTATENFWNTKEIIAKEAKILQDCLDGISKSKMKERIIIMFRYGLFQKKDIKSFSLELQKEFLDFIERH